MLTAKDIIRNEIQYLRAARNDYSDEHWTNCILADLAAAEITVERSSHIKELEEALRPFAKAWKDFEKYDNGNSWITGHADRDTLVTSADLRRARALIGGE